MPYLDKINFDGVVYDIVPNATNSQINANSQGLSYVNMMSGEEAVVDLYSIGGHGDISLSPEYKSLICVKDLLWQNQSPTSNFATQTINLDLSEYSELTIDYMESTTYRSIKSVSLEIPSTRTVMFSQCLAALGFRQITITTSSVQIENYTIYTSYNNTGSSSTGNQYMIPYRIWGWNPPVYIG